ncbi:Cytidine and deoxycytidylate deaminase zinc-binding region domain protein [Verrucomicrobiia bacterium DG1235]|nr:Cytidine and deoxycytidylate deaminase zinc-binding region domain protein [Verrucomicrobiae bacterium DG1235]
MTESALRVPKERTPEKSSTKKSNKADELISQSITDELVVAFCCPIGTPIQDVVNSYAGEIESRNYKVHKIKISRLIQEISHEILDSDDIIKRKNNYIKAGDNIRKKHKQSNYLAVSAIADILAYKKENKRVQNESDRICYLIDSLKHPDEINILKKVYGDSFFLIGVFSDRKTRIAKLTGGNTSLNIKAEDLIEADSKGHKESEPEYTQKLGKVFHQSDYFINTNGTDIDHVQTKIKRFNDIVFGTKLITPDIHEKSMYAAWSSASNSACMSRQVGASVVSKSGNIIGLGWNDVPKAGGGVYNDENTHNNKNSPPTTWDNRCYNWQEKQCLNDVTKNKIISKLADTIRTHFSDKLELHDSPQIEKLLKDSEIGDITEYSRAIHAEMHAIFNAFKDHSSEITGGSIYVTTFPCHNCARHIVLSGIMNIHFIEPYPKSRATILHRDTLTLDNSDQNQVRLFPFEGLAPSRYLDLLSYASQKRKDLKTCKLRDSDPKTESPRSRINLEAVSVLEKYALDQQAKDLDEQQKP